MRKTAIVLLFCLPGLALLSGCLQTRLTDPARSAVEQLLISTAADRAVQSLSTLSFVNKKVYVDTNYFEGYDFKYALGTIRDALSSGGALLVNDSKDSDIIVEPRSGALSIDSSQALIGIPSTAVPIPFVGSFALPELALFKSQSQFSLAKIAILAYDNRSHEHVFSSGPMVGRAFNKYYLFLAYLTYTDTDLPEKQKPQKPKKQKPHTKPAEK